MDSIEELKIILREKDCPFFSDEELKYYLKKYSTIENAAYHCLLIKAEDTKGVVRLKEELGDLIKEWQVVKLELDMRGYTCDYE